MPSRTPPDIAVVVTDDTAGPAADGRRIAGKMARVSPCESNRKNCGFSSSQRSSVVEIVSTPGRNDLSASKTKSPPRSTVSDPDAGETRAAVATTVAWMLLTLSCAAAQVVSFVMWLIARQVNLPADRPNALLLIPSTLMIVAVISGLLVLALTPFTYYVRKARPPLTVTIVALLISLLPIVSITAIALGSPAPDDRRPPSADSPKRNPEP